MEILHTYLRFSREWEYLVFTGHNSESTEIPNRWCEAVKNRLIATADISIY